MPVVFTNLVVTQFEKTLTYVTVASGTTTVGWPATRQTGDIAILIQNARSSITPLADATPSGFTQLSTDTGTLSGSGAGTRASVSYRVLDGSETGNISGGVNGNIVNRSYLWVFRPNFTISSATIARTYEASESAPANQTISVVGNYPMLFLATYESSSTFISTRTFTPTTGVLESQAAVSSFTKGRSFSSGASTTTVGMPDADSNALLSMRINVT